ncbi:leukocyte surface antigen CD53-like [Ostrinia nubilalis]|uniref:leukocyte surface antigen CD53-like n=1 Tax=Ostrinia nubilalis TaxID=29057 RepID=UPI00308258E2
MCCAEFLVKYILFFFNFVFTLAGIALIGLGIAALVQINQIVDLIPVPINGIPIAIIVLGSIIFVIAFFGCCGAIRESRCLLTMYFICMAILAAGKIYLATVIFGALDTLQSTVEGWVDTAFEKEDLRKVFHVLEEVFQCCGTTGPGSYVGVYPILPPTCCASGVAECTDDLAFGGCRARLGSYFENFGEAIAAVLIVVIVVELVAMLFGMFMCWSVSEKRQRGRYY